MSRRVEIPDGWTEFILSGNPTYEPGGHTLWGDPSLRMNSNGIPFTAGIFTQVPVQIGSRLSRQYLVGGAQQTQRDRQAVGHRSGRWDRPRAALQ